MHQRVLGYLKSRFSPAKPDFDHVSRNTLVNSLADYKSFVSNVGAGTIRPKGEPENYPAHFTLLEQPISALEYFHAETLNGFPPGHDVMLFAWESTGEPYGFPSDNENVVIRFNEERNPELVYMDILTFIEGVVVCFLQFSASVSRGRWVDQFGEIHTVKSSPLLYEI